MKFSRSLLLWSTLALCGVMVLGAMTWLTRGVLAAERERLVAESRADLEERTRLALWRMDSLGATLMLRENGYPPNDFGPLSTRFSGPSEPEVLLHFEVSNHSSFSSPELNPLEGETGPAAITLRKSREVLFNQLGPLLRRTNTLESKLNERLSNILKSIEEYGAQTNDLLQSDATMRQIQNSFQRGIRSGEQLRKDAVYQSNSNISEWAQRSKAVAQTLDATASQIENEKEFAVLTIERMRMALTNRYQVSQSLENFSQLRPSWFGEELILLREVSSPAIGGETEGRKSLQGVWMDRSAVTGAMLGEVADLLPNAQLVPSAFPDSFSLASLPFRLQRNETPVIPAVATNIPLLIGWIAVGVALLTVALLVHGVMRLSERRASFVSAVTHELRTPLTTFRLYSDMLESGAVKPEKRGDYLRVLSREADRLSHLVENVLSFSQIERGSARSVVRESTLADLLEPMRERLEARLAIAGMSLEMRLDPPAAAIFVRVDSATVEHILFNLIDNAAKYAAGSHPPQVEIRFRARPREVEILVSDHGPGIPLSERRRIFRAFHKSAREAAESRPGVGLGLALSRRLAKSLGGQLDCAASETGACFILRLPLAAVSGEIHSGPGELQR